MFNRGDEVATSDTIIGESVKVEGDFVGKGNVIIEGEVVGSIETTQQLRVGHKAKIHANVKAANATIAGEVRGNVSVAETLDLLSSAKVYGDVEAKVLSIEAGAIFNGKSSMGKEASERASRESAKTVEKIIAGSHT